MNSNSVIERATARRQLPAPAEARRIRERAGVSQGDLADHLGVSRQAVSRWEAGERRPRGGIVVAYVALLNQLRELAD